MNTYTDIFAGKPVSPSPSSYALYTISADLYLVWPFEALDGVNVAAKLIEITATTGGFNVFMPDASLESVGEDVVFTNIGNQSYTVVDNVGNTIIAVPPGQSWMVYLTDNSTIPGVWSAVMFGAVGSAVNATALAGYGLRARATQLDQNILNQSSSSPTRALTSTDRARVVRNVTGATTWTVDAIASLGPPPLSSEGWFTYLINAGTGTLTVKTTSGTIDGVNGVTTGKSLSPGESCILLCDGTNFETVGYGRSVVTSVTGVGIDLAGSGVLGLTSAQNAARVQDFTGTLTGARFVEYQGVGYWFVYNHTNGAYPVTFRLAGGTDPGVTVPQGSFSILRSNGTDLNIAF